MKKKNIVFFGGSFDPIHNGHIYMIDQLNKHFDVDEIILIPTYWNYMKEKPIFSSEDRFKCLQNIITKLPKAKINQKITLSDYEIKQKRQSYTVETLKYYENIYKNERFILLIGSDNFFEFHKWKNYELLLQSITLCVIRRDDCKLSQYNDYIFDKLHQKSFSSIMLIGNQEKKISSTKIRQKILNGEDVSGMVPPEVLTILAKKNK